MTERRRRKAAATEEPGQVLPHSLEAERAVLGAMLVNPAAQEKAARWLRRGRAFFRDGHRRIYAAMLRLVEERRVELDLLTLMDELKRTGELDDVGGAAYLSGLTDGVPRSANVAHYARIVFDDAVRRQVIRVGSMMAADAYDAELPVVEVVNKADAAVVELQRTRMADRLVDLRQDLGTLYEDFERRVAAKGTLTGVPTGFETLDDLTSGWQAGDMIVVGARPSMGKTAFVLNAALAAARANVGVLVFSLEMRRLQLQYRMMAALSGVHLSRILGGWTSEPEMQLLSDAMAQFGQLPIHVDDRSGQTIHDIRATCRQVRAESGLGLVVIDYAQLVTGSLDRRGITRREELDDISRRTKLLADDLNVPVVILSQLKRGEGRRPRLEDLKDSGAFEQDADLVLLLHRKHHRQSGKTLVLLEKQRNGPTGAVQLSFERDIQRFTDAGYEVTAEDAPEPEAAQDEAPKRRRSRPLKPAQPTLTDD